MSVELPENISWTELLEEYFSSVGEKSHSYTWLHSKAEAYYSFRRTFLDLPVIILSGAIGFCSVGQSTLFAGEEKMASITLGMSSLFVSILQSINSYFQFAKKCEGHRQGALHYAKLYRFICVEMGLPREERIRCSDLLKMVKNEFDRLAETCPPLPPAVINDFRSRFSDKKYDEISKPEECNGLEKIIVYDTTKQIKKVKSFVSIQSPSLQSSLPFSLVEKPKHIQTESFPIQKKQENQVKDPKEKKENHSNIIEEDKSLSEQSSLSSSQSNDSPAD